MTAVSLDASTTRVAMPRRLLINTLAIHAQCKCLESLHAYYNTDVSFPLLNFFQEEELHAKFN